MSSPQIFPRLLSARIAQALTDTPAVLLLGPRQAGKTTLVRQCAGKEMRYLTLDDDATRLAALQDPAGLIRSLDRVVLDEVQRAPGLLLAIKRSIDEDRRPGRFLLTGSANLITAPTVADSLAGRMETLTLLPLAQVEIQGSLNNWFDCLHKGVPLSAAEGEPRLVDRVLKGGYPEVLTRAIERRRQAWAQQYIDALIQRDIRELASVDKIEGLTRLLRALALTSGQIANFSQLAAQVGLDSKTAAKFVGIFEQMFILRRVEAWSSNRLSRLVKAPKIHFLDSGLLAALTGVTASEIERNRLRLGPLLEAFVCSELLKHLHAADEPYRIYHYRDADQYEVDFVLEDARGGLIGIEVKAAVSLGKSDLRGLRRFAQQVPQSFIGGMVLYAGDESLPLSDKIWAIPLSSLWA